MLIGHLIFNDPFREGVALQVTWPNVCWWLSGAGGGVGVAAHPWPLIHPFNIAGRALTSDWFVNCFIVAIYENFFSPALDRKL